VQQRHHCRQQDIFSRPEGETAQSWIHPTTHMSRAHRISTPISRTDTGLRNPQAIITVRILVMRTAREPYCLVPLPGQAFRRKIPSPRPQLRPTLLRHQGHPWVCRHPHIRWPPVTLDRRQLWPQRQHKQALPIRSLLCTVSVVGNPMLI